MEQHTLVTESLKVELSTCMGVLPRDRMSHKCTCVIHFRKDFIGFASKIHVGASQNLNILNVLNRFSSLFVNHSAFENKAYYEKNRGPLLVTYGLIVRRGRHHSIVSAEAHRVHSLGMAFQPAEHL